MTIMDKTKLDKVFSLHENSDVYSFMKDYAYKNQALAAALVRHFLPDKIDVDALRNEVQDMMLCTKNN